MAQKWDADNKRWFDDTGRALDQDKIDNAKRQDTSGLGSVTRKPVSQADEEDESKMSPMQLAAYRTKKKRQSSMTGADAAAALAARK